VTPLTIRSKRPGSSAGHSCFSTVRLAGTQSPKSRPVAYGVEEVEIGPQPHPNRPPGPLSKPPGVFPFGNEQRQLVGAERGRPGVPSVSRNV
jgi:hypothetical protein